MEVMRMPGCKLLLVVVLCSILLCYHTSSAGPARQLASLAARASKIPRSIRAPFRHSEMMTARGFGKRGVSIGAIKRETGKLIEELTADNSAPVQQMIGEPDSFPLDWLANEMSENPALARTILQRFIDANKDGLLTTHELISSSVSDSNDLF